jgi:hypothetical protein
VSASEDVHFLFAINPNDFPLAYPIINRSQKNDRQLQEELVRHPNHYDVRVLQEHPIVFYHRRIVVTPKLHDPLLQWYHTQLLHPGKDRLVLNSVKHHFTWKNMMRDVKNLV